MNEVIDNDMESTMEAIRLIINDRNKLLKENKQLKENIKGHLIELSIVSAQQEDIQRLQLDYDFGDIYSCYKMAKELKQITLRGKGNV